MKSYRELTNSLGGGIFFQSGQAQFGFISLLKGSRNVVHDLTDNGVPGTNWSDARMRELLLRQLMRAAAYAVDQLRQKVDLGGRSGVVVGVRNILDTSYFLLPTYFSGLSPEDVNWEDYCLNPAEFMGDADPQDIERWSGFCREKADRTRDCYLEHDDVSSIQSADESIRHYGGAIVADDHRGNRWVISVSGYGLAKQDEAVALLIARALGLVTEQFAAYVAGLSDNTIYFETAWEMPDLAA